MGRKDAAYKLMGKTIIGLVKKENIRGTTPASQIFLLFSDHTYYEFYSFSEILGTSDVDEGGVDQVRGYGKGTMRIVDEILVPE